MAWKRNPKGKKRNYVRKSKHSKKLSYKDTYNFKLTGSEINLYDYLDGTGNAQIGASGAGIQISGRGTPTGSRARFSGVLTFAGQQTTQWSQLNTLFDRYRINAVKVKIIPEWNSSDTQGTGVLPVMKVCQDFDDSAISTVGDIWARRGKLFRLTKPVTLTFSPRTINFVSLGSSTNAAPAGTNKSTFLNCSYGMIPHYGLKFAIKDWYLPNSASANVILRFEVTYLMTFKTQLNVGALGHTGLEENTFVEEDDANVEKVACELQPEPVVVPVPE